MSILQFYGTSDSRGVPRLLCNCPVCATGDADNMRLRPSASFHTGSEQILIDVSPDFRSQFLRYHQGTVPRTALITHAHNDHIAGLGDYDDLCFWNGVMGQVHSPTEVTQLLAGKYPHAMKRGLKFIASDEVELGEWLASFHRVNHGFNGYSYGIRFRKQNWSWAYVSDAFHVTDEQWQPFRGVDLLVLGTSFWHETLDVERRSVYDVMEALELKDTLGVGRVLLTHLSHDIDVPARQNELPDGFAFARDGLTVELP